MGHDAVRADPDLSHNHENAESVFTVCGERDAESANADAPGVQDGCAEAGAESARVSTVPGMQNGDPEDPVRTSPQCGDRSDAAAPGAPEYEADFTLREAERAVTVL